MCILEEFILFEDMLLTKEQIYRLYCFLNFLTDKSLEINVIKFRGDDIIILVEPIKGEIENRAWRITSEGELIDSPSFFHE